MNMLAEHAARFLALGFRVSASGRAGSLQGIDALYPSWV